MIFTSGPAPHVFGLPPGADFPAALVAGLLAHHQGQPPEAMARITLFLNTQRMRRRVRECLLAKGATFLPRLRLVTELKDDPLLSGTDPGVSALGRRLELAVLIDRLLAAEPDLAPRAALYELADSLAALMDEMRAEDVSPGRLAALDMEGHAAHWARIGRRPDRHQNRQSRNAQDAYRACTQPWLAHLDVDEFLLPDLPPGEILAGLPRHQAMLRAEPFEAMHDPTLPDDIYTARLFRGALRDPHAALRPAVLGPYAGVLPQAMLSHLAGKAFFRTGIKGLSPRLHGAFLNGERLPGPPFDPRLRLLHFHAQDRAAWQAALPFRLTRGAYQYHPELQSHLAAATPEQVAAFYATTQELTADSIAVLRKAGRLVEADLHLADKVAQLEKARDGHA